MRDAKPNAKTVPVTDDRILGHLAQRFAVSEENLATEALTWLLRRSSAARAALVGLARTAGADVPDELTFIGQVSSPGAGRPDVVGLDVSSRERLLIEAKFAAALTDQQPSGYLKRLKPDVDGVLLVVAPTVRLPALWVELLRGPRPGGHRTVAVGGSHGGGVEREGRDTCDARFGQLAQLGIPCA